MTLRKLHMWGEKVSADKINFEWPTKADLECLPPNAQITELKLKWRLMKTDYYSLSEIKIRLSEVEEPIKQAC